MTGLTIGAEKKWYRPGEVVRGTVTLDLPHPRKIGGLSLDAMGIERTEITVTHYSGRTAHSHTYTSQNLMHRFGVLLQGAGMIEAGSHDFPFEFRLPRNLLPTYHGQFAAVSYTITANLDIPMWFDANKVVEYHVVPDARSVKLNPSPVTLASENSSNPGKPGFIVELDRASWVAGETVTGVLELTGDGGKRVRKADIALKTLELATAEGHQRDAVIEIAKGFVSGTSLCVGERVPFGLKIPRVIYSSYKGIYSSLNWLLNVNLDIAWGYDTQASQGLIIVNSI